MSLDRLQNTPPWDWPRDADTILLKPLRDPKATAADRELAAELAGDVTVINDDLAAALLAILRNNRESDELRGRSAVAFGPVLESVDVDGLVDPDDPVDPDGPADPASPPISDDTLHNIQETLTTLYQDTGIPKHVRRRALEASVRAEQDWHVDAIRAAYTSSELDWRVTAVFAMRYWSGFDDQILESLASDNADIHYQAVCAAGVWEIDAAWRHVLDLAMAEETEKRLRLAAIEAVAAIRPDEAGDALDELSMSDDEDIAFAVEEALAAAEAYANGFYDEDDFDTDTANGG